MYSPLSSQFLLSARQSGRVATVCDFYVSGTLVKSNVPVVSGSITADANADIRRSASLTILAPGDVTTTESAVSGRRNAEVDLREFFTGVDIYQTEIVVKSGFIYSFGNYELVPLGRYMIWSASLSYTRGNAIDLELFDRAKYMEQAGVLKLYDFSGVAAQTAIQTLVTNSLPQAQTVIFGSGVTNMTLPGGTTYDNNHLDAAIDIATTLGCIFYFDNTGQARVDIKPKIDNTTTLSQAQFRCNTGEPDGNIISLSRSTSRDEIFNGVGVYGSQPNENTAQAYGEAFDLNPASRTYWQGPFGKAFTRIDRPELTTNQQCYDAAVAELNRSVGGAVPTNLEILFNPALEPSDLISVYYPQGDPEVHLIDTLDYDIGEAHMQLTTRGKTTSG